MGGVKGKFHLEIVSVRAGFGKSSPVAKKNIVQLAESVPDLSTLVTALSKGGLVSALEAKGPFTVFAPTNEAFAKLPKATLASLLEPQNKKKLDAILEYHVVAGVAAYAKDLHDGQMVKTLEGQKLTVHISGGGGVRINDSNVIKADVGASNGVVHLIDTVLIPPELMLALELGDGGDGEDPFWGKPNIVQIAASNKDFSTLVAALKAGGLVGALEGRGPFTVFAPTNEAFAKLPAGTLQNLLKPENKAKLVSILEYHVVAGAAAYARDLKDGEELKTLNGADVEVHIGHNGVRINNSDVIKADISASNGVIHAVDKVLLPPALTATQLPYESRNIVEVAAGNKNFSTLVAALKAGGLVSALEAKGPYTVFAPTNSAFAKLPAGVLASLLKDKKKLDAILEYHVVAGTAAYAKDLKNGEMIKTLEGADVEVHLSRNGVRINNSNVVVADIAASNGVVHAIDTVLLPPNLKPDPVEYELISLA